ncbi:alkaline phosphatase D [Saccharopolyspora kobensis]|uniref:Alkaline phosphatase D n=1 Tax=Saccharopolyspora kobensis TaxID=146035 RepID=A0A1H6E8Z7_9PSEU|nr:alkaline phosphatase D family protein [Saccharopolyspora kobensis]SEG93325.1 alkaline phosphatase D [Saccharopolyspora kobensis]SFD44321.1 alkaline phosphatase D [Saccharopolyspora kobensis]
MPGNSLSRRSVLLSGAVLAAAAPAVPAAASELRGVGRPMRPGQLFTLGVASGEPLPHGVVLWTRLARDPLAENGLGGMPDQAIKVDWEVATDERFKNVVQRGQAEASPRWAHSVHVEANGLRPGTEYFYRFRARGELSPVGRTRTAPAPGTLGALTMCFASCAHYGEGFFTAYRRMAEDEPGLILHLGDYQYEYADNPSKNVRKVEGPETVTLANYRQRHAQYKTDPDLQLAHATAPWLVVFDDHEIENNWAAEVPEDKSETPGQAFLERRRAAFQAYYENMPLRWESMPQGNGIRLYRRRQWGSLANFHMLDTRQYRDDQAYGDGNKPDGPDLKVPERTITGKDQEVWLLDGLRQSRARWDVLGQQVWFAQMDHDPGPAKILPMDAWDGYQASRQRIKAGFSTTRNVVVLTGDVHSHWAADLKDDFDDSRSRTVAVELTTTSVTSGRDGADTNEGGDKLKAANEHVHFYSARRGYVRTQFTPEQVRADYRVLPYVSKPNAPVTTAASFITQDRDPGLHAV